MKVVLVIENDPVVRRAVAEVLLAAGYGVCEAWNASLIPAVPRLHAVVSDVTADLGAPLVTLMGRDFDHAELLARVRLAVDATEERAA
jgi:CheY-like chemotaxis protein